MFIYNKASQTICFDERRLLMYAGDGQATEVTACLQTGSLFEQGGTRVTQETYLGGLSRRTGCSQTDSKIHPFKFGQAGLKIDLQFQSLLDN